MKETTAALIRWCRRAQFAVPIDEVHNRGLREGVAIFRSGFILWPGKERAPLTKEKRTGIKEPKKPTGNQENCLRVVKDVHPLLDLLPARGVLKLESDSFKLGF